MKTIIITSAAKSNTGHGRVSLELINFVRYASFDAVLNQLNRIGLRPATIHELRTFAENCSDEDITYGALGSVHIIHGYYHVPVFHPVDGFSVLGCQSRWNDENYRILAIRK